MQRGMRCSRASPKADDGATVEGNRLAPNGEPASGATDATGSDLRPADDDEAISTPETPQEGNRGMPRMGFEGMFEGDGWRLESKGDKRFGFRRGGGYQRQTMRGAYLKEEQLSEEQYEQHKRNAERQGGAKHRARRTRGG